jgi:hypothetical protein
MLGSAPRTCAGFHYGGTVIVEPPQRSEGPPTGTAPAPPGHRSPYERYSRILTRDGGILITYQDQVCGLLYSALRVSGWSVASTLTAWLILIKFDMSGLRAGAALFAAFALYFFIANLKIKRRHQIEIRPDSMIIDGTDIFLAEQFGENYPELRMPGSNPNRLSIGGTYGTRYIELCTVNRLNANDRTPEILAAHLKEAIEQLWARREIMFD